MKIKGWNNGTKKASGAGYGFRVSLKDRDLYFNKEWTNVSIILDEEDIIEIAITPSFWNKCHELRSKEIGKWLIKKGFQFWAKGKPPEFTMVQIRNNKFKILNSGIKNG